MPESITDEEATALLRAAERSLFDATARLEQAMAAMGRRPPPDAAAMVERARLWSKLIQAGLDRFGRTIAASAA